METPHLRRDHWRKSSQWFTLTRPHAALAVADRHVSEVFHRYCYSRLATFPTAAGGLGSGSLARTRGPHHPGTRPARVGAPDAATRTATGVHRASGGVDVGDLGASLPAVEALARGRNPGAHHQINSAAADDSNRIKANITKGRVLGRRQLGAHPGGTDGTDPWVLHRLLTSSTPPCVSDEHFLPTLLASYGLEGQTDCLGASHFADWSWGGGWHPRSFLPGDLQRGALPAATAAAATKPPGWRPPGTSAIADTDSNPAPAAAPTTASNDDDGATAVGPLELLLGGFKGAARVSSAHTGGASPTGNPPRGPPAGSGTRSASRRPGEEAVPASARFWGPDPGCWDGGKGGAGGLSVSAQSVAAVVCCRAGTPGAAERLAAGLDAPRAAGDCDCGGGACEPGAEGGSGRRKDVRLGGPDRERRGRRLKGSGSVNAAVQQAAGEPSLRPPAPSLPASPDDATRPTLRSWLEQLGYMPLGYRCHLFARKLPLLSARATYGTAMACPPVGLGLGPWCPAANTAEGPEKPVGPSRRSSGAPAPTWSLGCPVAA